MRLDDFETALGVMDFPITPAWLDHPVVAMWFTHFSSTDAPPPMPFCSGAELLTNLPPKATFRAASDTLHDAALIHANKPRHSVVLLHTTIKMARADWGHVAAKCIQKH
jgi:hypothetical protein